MNTCKLLLAMMLVSLNAYGQVAPIEIKRGFFAGTDFVKAPEVVRQVYLSGLVDGIYYSPVLGAPKAQLLPIERCISPMTSVQLVAIADQYMARHPERWDWDMNVLFFLALIDACKSRGIEIK